jgi:hypothetical protein
MITPSIRALHRMVTGQRLEEVERRIGRKLTEEERTGLLTGEHAGTWETSWYLAQRPDLVAPDYKHLGDVQPPRAEWLVRLGEDVARALSRAGREGGARKARELFGSVAGSAGWLLNARFGYGRDGERVSYKGWPAVASVEVGRTYAELPVEMCLEDVEAVTEGRMSPADVRSIASDHALIQPGFFRGVAALLAALALFAWILW